jgi:PQQ-like domain
VDWLPEFQRDVECPLWVTPTGGQPTAAVIGGGGATLYVAPTCAPTWEAAAAGGTTQPAVAGGVVITTSSHGVVEAFDAAGCGEPACHSLWTDRSGIDGLSAPVVSGGQVYVAGGGTLLACGRK